MYGKVAQWLDFCAVNHDIMDSSPAETVYNFFSRMFYLIIFVVDLFAYCPRSLFFLNHNNAHTT